MGHTKYTRSSSAFLQTVLQTIFFSLEIFGLPCAIILGVMIVFHYAPVSSLTRFWNFRTETFTLFGKPNLKHRFFPWHGSYNLLSVAYKYLGPVVKTSLA